MTHAKIYLRKHFADAEYDLCFKPQADEYDGLNGRPLVAECPSGCLSLGYMIKNKDPAGTVENYEYFIERGCKDDLVDGNLATCENAPEWDSNGKSKTAWCAQDLTFANHGNHGIIKGQYQSQFFSFKKNRFSSIFGRTSRFQKVMAQRCKCWS